MTLAVSLPFGSLRPSHNDTYASTPICVLVDDILQEAVVCGFSWAVVVCYLFFLINRPHPTPLLVARAGHHNEFVCGYFGVEV